MKIFVTRHGQTEWNVLEKLQGQTDIELNDVGRKQAEEAGELIKNENINLIITSPLKRARETAEIINKNLNAKIIEDPRLMERKYGVFEGTKKGERKIIKEENPEIKDIWNYKKNVELYDMETMKNFCNRVYEFLDEVIEKYEGKDILIVTHGGTSVPIKYYFMKYSLEDIMDRDTVKGLENCEVAKFIV